MKRKERTKERNVFELSGFPKERKKEIFSKWVVLKRKERNIFEVCEFEKERKKYFRGVWF